MASQPKRFSQPLIIILVVFALVGCSNPTLVPSPIAAPLTPVHPTLTNTPLVPTPTPVTMGLLVNGEGIPLVEVEAELARLQAALRDLGRTSTVEEQRQMVLEELTNQLLLASAAGQNGYIPDETVLQARIETLASQMGGSGELIEWQSSNAYTPESFTASLRRQIAADWQKAQIYAAIQETAEQVHARQILVFDEESAQDVVDRLADGIEFATLAFRYDPITGGDLGWFPRGYLTAPEVEEAAFGLPVGKVSPIIHSQVGYHVVQVIGKDPQRLLSSDARYLLQQTALESWLARAKENAQIEIHLPE